MSGFNIREITSDDRDWISRFIAERWGSDRVIAHQTIFCPHDLPGFVAINGGEKWGLVTFHIDDDSCEIVSIDSVRPSIGIGSALIAQVKKPLFNLGVGDYGS